MKEKNLKEEDLNNVNGGLTSNTISAGIGGGRGSVGDIPQLEDEELKDVVGGDLTWEEMVEASKNWLPEGDVTCLNLACQKTFNAKDNAFGFQHTTYSNGLTTTYAVAKCPYCGWFWKGSKY